MIGSLPSLVSAPSNSYSPAWGRGEQRALQRHWDSGDREDWTAPYALTCTADELADEHARDVVRTSPTSPSAGSPGSTAPALSPLSRI
ncbi:hypothetical protein ABZ446_45510 [Streptomyces sp. NPDC005813]|uniref:hypothetical protein n=1 Tax=Streptomyces sp. NPDC005813 TaxID=3155592 RepID=UPI00340244BF